MISAYKIETNLSELKNAYSPFIDQLDQTILRGIISPDDHAPIIRNNLDGAELALSRWGMPSPNRDVKIEGDIGVTQIQKIETEYWHQWASVDHRCLIPANAFQDSKKLLKPATEHQSKQWFSLDRTQPVFFFAGIWTEWVGTRKASEGQQNHTVFAILVTEREEEPNKSKITPVILTEPDAWDIWMTEEWKIAKLLIQPLGSGKIIII